MSEGATRQRMAIGETELLRPIISAWCDDKGVVAPQAFNLSSADKQDSNRLSIVRGDATTPDQAYADRASHIKKRCDEKGKAYVPPVGVMAVTVDEVESVEITTRADDGIVLYVNGTEVLRKNVDPGTAGVGTYANAAVGASTALANPCAM